MDFHASIIGYIITHLTLGKCVYVSDIYVQMRICSLVNLRFDQG